MSELGTASAYDDDRYLHVSNNLSEIADFSVVRNNLGLGSAALLNAGTESGDLLTRINGDARWLTVFGTTAGTACEGNDARLSNTRTPTSHNNSLHSDINQSLLTTDTVRFGAIGVNRAGNTTYRVYCDGYISGTRYYVGTTRKDANWDAAYSEKGQWDGGSTNLVAANGRASLGLKYASAAEQVDPDVEDRVMSPYGTHKALSSFLPSGTKTFFKQNSAPTGWTFVSEDNDKVLINASTVGQGGDVGGNWTIGLSVDGHALTKAQMPTHNHSGTSLSYGGSGQPIYGAYS
jgi:hypothetical protein